MDDEYGELFLDDDLSLVLERPQWRASNVTLIYFD